MAITRHETQVQWSSSNSVSVTAGSNQTSDEVNLDATCIAAQISLKADNSTTPASDDIIHFWAIQTSGDPDGASTDEFDSTDTGAGDPVWLGSIDTSQTDGAQITRNLPLPQKGLKVYAEGATAGTTNSITVSATITEQRAA